jgi:hypothetical protein
LRSYEFNEFFTVIWYVDEWDSFRCFYISEFGDGSGYCYDWLLSVCYDPLEVSLVFGGYNFRDVSAFGNEVVEAFDENEVEFLAF